MDDGGTLSIDCIPTVTQLRTEAKEKTRKTRNVRLQTHVQKCVSTACQTNVCLPPQSLPNVQFQLLESDIRNSRSSSDSEEEGLEHLMFGM